MTNKTNSHKEIDILTIGDVCIDLYMKLENDYITQDNDPVTPRICFYHGAKIPVKTLKDNIAGNALNVAVGAKNLGLRSALYTEMGDDEYAQRIIDELNQRGILTEYISMKKEYQTGIHPVIVFGGERTIFTHHEERDYRVEKIPDAKWIYYTSIGPGFEEFQKEFIEYIKKHPQTGIAFNPGTYHLKSGLEKIKNILKVVHILLVNKDEAILLVGKHDLEDLHKKLHELGPALTVITDGGRGASGYDGENIVKVDAYKIDEPIADKTGAGDAFSSGFLSAICYKKSLEEALQWGAINSSGAIREVGAIHGIKSKHEINEIIKKL